MKNLFVRTCRPVVGLLLIGLLPLLSVSAQQRSPTPPPPSLGSALNPDGTLRPGAQGTFDPTGYELQTDPTTGTPSFRPTAGLADWEDGYVNTSLDNQWHSPANWSADCHQAKLAAIGHRVAAAGAFVYAGGLDATNAAIWDGGQWKSLPEIGGRFLNDVQVHAIASTGSNLYVAGNIYSSTNQQDYSLLRWNGARWSRVGSAPPQGIVFEMATQGNNLYIAGDFPSVGGIAAERIARWDGTTWHALGTGLPLVPSAITATTNGDVFAVLNLTATSYQVMRWDGTTWTDVTAGLPPNSYLSLAATATATYALAAETLTPTTSRTTLYQRTGGAWTPVGPPLLLTVGTTPTGPPIGGMAEGFFTAHGSDVFIGGTFSVNSPLVAHNLIRWDGTQWSGLDVQPGGAVGGIAFTGDSVFVSGCFTTTGNQAHSGLALWHGAQWRSLGKGASSPVMALTVAGTDVYVGGTFSSIGGIWANRIARWDGTTWHALSSGLGASPTSNNTAAVRAIAVRGADVFVGGDFTTAGGASAPGIARWDGTTWHPLGSGLGRPAGRPLVRALAVRGTDLFVGGLFATSGGQPAANIARWDGTTWHALGSGTNADVNALAVVGSDLYAGGRFRQAGGVAVEGVARWDGTTWTPLPFGSPDQSGPVESMLVVGTTLYIGGDFAALTPTGTQCPVAYWNGATWVGLASNGNLPVSALAVVNGRLYAGNWASNPDNYIGYGVRWWDLTSGTPGELDTTPDGDIAALAGSNGLLYVGGAFSTLSDYPFATNRKLSGNFAIYRGTPPLSVAASTSPLPFTLSPNPARESVRLSGAGKTAFVTQHDAHGRQVRTLPLTGGATVLPLTDLTPGLYVVRVGGRAQRLIVD